MLVPQEGEEDEGREGKERRLMCKLSDWRIDSNYCVFASFYHEN